MLQIPKNLLQSKSLEATSLYSEYGGGRREFPLYNTDTPKLFLIITNNNYKQ